MATATAAQTHISASLYLSIRDVKGVNSSQIHALPRLPLLSNISRISTSFTRGSPLGMFS
ncbi:hypothetical protein ACHQM5_016066 [Ranunculus cassubicifolius]